MSLQEELEVAIDKITKHDRMNAELAAEETDAAELDAVRRRVLEAMR